MHRREFFHSAALGAALGGPRTQLNAATAKPALMKAGTQHDSSDDVLPVLAALGVEHICSTLPSTKLDEHWSVEGLKRLRERIESRGIKLDMAPLPLSSNYISKYENPGILLGKSPQRDREIDDICQMIRNAAQ